MSCYRCQTELRQKQTYFARLSPDGHILIFCSVRCLDAYLSWSEHAYTRADSELEHADYGDKKK